MAKLKNTNVNSSVNAETMALGGGAVTDYIIDYYPKTKADYDAERALTGNYRYRYWKLYKSGWLEQGGYIFGENVQTINFLKPFKDTEYFVNETYTYSTNITNGNSISVEHHAVARDSTTQCRIRTLSDNLGQKCVVFSGWSADAFK